MLLELADRADDRPHRPARHGQPADGGQLRRRRRWASASPRSVDPTQGGQAAAIGNFLTLLGMALIFATDAHHVVIAAIRGSYRVLPPGQHARRRATRRSWR